MDVNFMSKSLDGAFVSVILVKAKIDEKKISSTLENLHMYLSANYSDHEIVLVDDTAPALKQFDYSKLLRKIPFVRVIKLASQVDYQLACSAGLENAIGDYVILFDPKYDSTDLIAQSVELSKAGFDVVVGVNKSPKESLIYKAFRPLANRLLKVVGYDTHRSITSFYCLSRGAVNAVTMAASQKYQLHIRILQSGLKTSYLSYKQNNGIKKTVIGAIPELLNMIVFNSVKPLRFVTLMAICVSLFNLSYAIYSFLQKIFNSMLVDGWASTSVLISIMFTFLFIILAFFAEYISRLLNENNKSESYKIMNELNSSVMIDEDRLNVADKSL